MSFKKPFRAVPMKLGSRYRRKQRHRERLAATKLLAVAAIMGATTGVGSVMLDENGRASIGSAIRPVAVQLGTVRAREPQIGDVWRGCDDARAAGTAPIYSAEPGYSQDMDGDGDGIACEPYR